MKPAAATMLKDAPVHQYCGWSKSRAKGKKCADDQADHGRDEHRCPRRDEDCHGQDDRHRLRDVDQADAAVPPRWQLSRALRRGR
jgi:hypothetical protein